MKPKGIFCLEGDWWGVRDRTTVEPVLRLLETHGDYRVPYIHRDIGTREEFEHYLSKWTLRRLKDYPILYLGFHGDRGLIRVGEGEIPLDQLADLLRGKCSGKVIHFGSCSTLDVHGAKLNRFLRTTEALAICGYRSEPDWLQSSALDILLLGAMQSMAMTKAGMNSVRAMVRQQAPGLARKLGLRMVVRR
jgi:hypothetical protein